MKGIDNPSSTTKQEKVKGSINVNSLRHLFVTPRDKVSEFGNGGAVGNGMVCKKQVHHRQKQKRSIETMTTP